MSKRVIRKREHEALIKAEKEATEKRLKKAAQRLQKAKLVRPSISGQDMDERMVDVLDPQKVRKTLSKKARNRIKRRERDQSKRENKIRDTIMRA